MTQLINQFLLPTKIPTRFGHGITQLRPVTMEGQKFKIAEDPSQPLSERSPMGPILWICFGNFPTFRKKNIFRGDLEILKQILG